MGVGERGEQGSVSWGGGGSSTRWEMRGDGRWQATGGNRRWDTGGGTWWEAARSACCAEQAPMPLGHPWVGETPPAANEPHGAPVPGAGSPKGPGGERCRGCPALLTCCRRGELHDEGLPAEDIGPAGLAAVVVVVASQHGEDVCPGGTQRCSPPLGSRWRGQQPALVALLPSRWPSPVDIDVLLLVAVPPQGDAVQKAVGVRRRTGSETWGG